MCSKGQILNPQKILAIGLNYADHVKESGMETPKIPMVFNKQSSSVTGHNGVIHLPRASETQLHQIMMNSPTLHHILPLECPNCQEECQDRIHSVG